MKLELEGLKRKVSEYFEQCGYITKLNSELLGSSGFLHKVDVLAIDKRLSEVRIACKCQAGTFPVNETSLLSWVKICEDIHAVPAFASTSNYADSALKAAEKFGFILLIFDEELDSIVKVETKPVLSDFLEDSRILVYRADKALSRAKKLIRKLGDLSSEEKSEEFKKIRSEVESLCREAESLYKKALEQKPDKETWLKLGNLYSSYLAEYLPEDYKKYEKEAIGCYVNALKEHIKDFPVLLRKLGLETFHKFELQQKIEELFNVAFTSPIEYKFLHTLRLRRIEHFQISLLKMYLEKHPEDVEAWLSLADHYRKVGSPRSLSESEKACEKALEIDPNNPAIISRVSKQYIYLAESSLQKDKREKFFDKAIQLLKKCCELEPNRPIRWIDLAEAYERKGSFDEARKYLEKAIKISETPYWSALKKLGDLHFLKGEKEKALECYAKAIDAKLEFKARLKLEREG